MKTKAAVLTDTDEPLEITEIEVPDLEDGEILVDIAYSGVCHTQVLEARGFRGEDPYLPHCLGHEGAGTVLETGRGVTTVQPGDDVILSWMKGEGAEVPSTEYRDGDRTINAGAITTFQHVSVVSENRVTSIPEGLDLREAALLGCAVPTGAGAVLNTATAEAGESLAVFGTGGIGLAAVSAASAAGCTPVIAVDVLPSKLKKAAQVGATHTVNASEVDPVQEIEELTSGGVDVAIEASGRPSVMREALQSVHPRGGRAVVIGNAHHDETLEIDPGQLNQGKQLRGTWGGDNDPAEHFPRYAKMIRDGALATKPLLSKTYGLDEINQAIEDLEAGRVVRPLVDLREGGKR